MHPSTSLVEHTIYLALGANIGDRRHNLAKALHMLQKSVTIQTVSPVYETDPVGYLAQPRFLNLVCLGYTTLAPDALLSTLKAIEHALGRQPTFRNGPRPLDVDILLYDDLQLTSPQLTLPHPRMIQRTFVLAPLADIAPSLVLPGQTRTVLQLLQGLPQTGLAQTTPISLLNDEEPEAPI